MKDYGNLWDGPLTEGTLNTTENVIDLMKAQCQYLKQSTDGKVKGLFRVIKKQSKASAVLSASLTAIQQAGIPDIAVEETEDDLMDANDLFHSTRFGFEMYNSTYKFRLFDVSILPTYPINLVFDEGVYTEIEKRIDGSNRDGVEPFTVPVSNDDQLMRCFGLAINSRKVRYILARLTQDEPSGE